MNSQMLRDLLARLDELERRPKHRTGIVTDDSPLAVAIAGSDVSYTNVKALDGTTFVIGDSVSVLTFANDLIVLGRIV